MKVQAHDVLNRYLAKELGRSFILPDLNDLSRQRAAFLERYGADRLAQMSRSELLQELPFNTLNEKPMDYWLEFKNDEEFNNRLFGGITGGSAAKFGTWQDKKSGSWRAPFKGSIAIENISEDEALTILEERRRELLSAVAVMQTFDAMPLEDIDPQALQRAIVKAAPRWHLSVWMHKYLHLTFPDLVTWAAANTYSMSELYRVGIVPEPSGNFARNCHIIRFWSSLPALKDVPIQLRYRCSKNLGPRDHWGLMLTNDSAWQDMLDSGHLTLGPAQVGNITEAIALNKKLDIKEAIETAFHSADLDAKSSDAHNLIELGYRLKEGQIIALFSDATTVVAVGEVAGTYRFVPKASRPHQVPVRWHHNQRFQTTAIPKMGTRMTTIAPDHPATADIEASLIVNGVGPWPNFSDMAASPPSQRAWRAADSPLDSKRVALPPLEGISRQVVEMLDRKRQVILYGPPGTGKTHHAERIALEIVARHNFGCLPSQLSEPQRELTYGRSGGSPYIAITTFHPMYSYEDFIEGYRPDGAGFKLEPGIFKQLVDSAHAQPNKRFVLIIDEINRGNIPKIFGELITLIEASKRGITSAQLPLSKEPFTVADNLLIIGTMNTADRSILLLDTALRRRFAFRELLPEPHLLRSGSIADISLSAWLRALNRRIIEQLGRDGRNLQIGHAYLMPAGKPAATLRRIGEIVRDELWPLLQEYCYEDPNKLANILAADKGGVFDRTSANLRFDLFEPGHEDELAQALIAIVTPEDKKLDATLGEDAPDEDEPDDLDVEVPTT